MPEQKEQVDLTSLGNKAVFDTAKVSRCRIMTSMAAYMGDSVLTAYKSTTGELRRFAPNRLLSSQISDTMGLDTRGVDSIVLEVTSADSSAQEITVSMYSEETE